MLAALLACALLALAGSGCTLRFARTHTCADICPRVFGAGSRDSMPGGPVNAGGCMCSFPGNPDMHGVVRWKR